MTRSCRALRPLLASSNENGSRRTRTHYGSRDARPHRRGPSAAVRQGATLRSRRGRPGSQRSSSPPGSSWGSGLHGHCIPIDPFYLTWKAREFDFRTRFIELAGEINQNMPYYCRSRASQALNYGARKSLSGSDVLVLGVAYKSRHLGLAGVARGQSDKV
jgi:UDP-glucose/GDP-mannose dehydrogenase family, central domain